jgi:hypothetical protein
MKSLIVKPVDFYWDELVAIIKEISIKYAVAWKEN